MTKKINLSKGGFALIDDEDFKSVSKFSWCCVKCGNKFYARTTGPRNGGQGATIYLHSYLLSPPQGYEIDHIDGDSLNNQKNNLRIVTRRENLQNLHIKKTSRFPGVSKRHDMVSWRAAIKINGKSKHLGYFESEFEAHLKYLEACRGVPA